MSDIAIAIVILPIMFGFIAVLECTRIGCRKLLAFSNKGKNEIKEYVTLE